MAFSFTFNCPLPNGIHARPAKLLEDKAAELALQVKWLNMRNGRSADLPGVLRLLGTDTKSGDPCELVIEGERNRAQRFFDWLCHELARDDAKNPISVNELQPLPPVLAALGCQAKRAIAANTGIAIGQRVLIRPAALNQVQAPVHYVVKEQRQRLSNALEMVTARLSKASQQADHPGDIARGQFGLISDNSFRQQLLSVDGAAETAVQQTNRYYRELLARDDSAYLKERELDVRDICLMLMDVLQPGWRRKPERIPEDAIVWAPELTPGQFLNLDRSRLKGLMLAHGGSTSHTVILARAFGIPTLVGAVEPVGERLILDGELGLYINDPTPAVERWYRRQLSLIAARSARLSMWRDRPGFSRDGQKMELGANIASATEAGPAFAAGAEGIGLFRTEMLFMDREQAPTEQEQFLAYQDVVLASAGRPVIIRTMDIGGDKPVEYLNFGEENNPFLGYRAVRIYREYEDLFREQLRAILRASAYGKVRLMLPMVHSVHEIKWVRGVLDDECERLEELGVDFDYNMEFGVMLEVPSVAFIIDACCEVVDFFSIGSNDLTQYLLAVDRENARIAGSYNSMHPAVLALIDHVVQKAHAHGKWVGLCGELGGDLRALPLLLGLHLDEISMAAPQLTETRAKLARLDSRRCRELVNKAMQCDDGDRVAAMLEQATLADDKSVFDRDLVLLDLQAQDKADVIEQMVGQLWVTGRADDRRLLERDVWAREETSSTALGGAIAIPHGKSVQVDMSSVIVARLAEPIDWQASDGQPVDLVIMLVMPEFAAEVHLRILSALARRLVDESFQQALRNYDTAEALVAFLEQELTAV